MSISANLFLLFLAHKYKRRDTPRPVDFEKKSFKPRGDISQIFSEEDEDEKEPLEDESFLEIAEEETVTKVYEEVTDSDIFSCSVSKINYIKVDINTFIPSLNSTEHLIPNLFCVIL